MMFFQCVTLNLFLGLHALFLYHQYLLYMPENVMLIKFSFILFFFLEGFLHYIYLVFIFQFFLFFRVCHPFVLYYYKNTTTVINK